MGAGPLQASGEERVLAGRGGHRRASGVVPPPESLSDPGDDTSVKVSGSQIPLPGHRVHLGHMFPPCIC